MQRRRRELMTYIDSECTFQPRINSRRSTASRATTDEFGAEAGAFERLYSAAKERDMKLKERASRLDDECTFRPSVSGRHSLTRMSVDGTGRSTFEVLYEKVRVRSAVLRLNAAGIGAHMPRPAWSRSPAYVLHAVRASCRPRRLRCAVSSSAGNASWRAALSPPS
ncbi:hypothetical protein EON67_03715 [archaeon]|nr:MAG: hypothetical protein EON67_03715 [archaeon]